MPAMQSFILQKEMENWGEWPSGRVKHEQMYSSGTLSQYSEDMASSPVLSMPVELFRQPIFQAYADVTSQIEALLRHIELRHILIPKPGELRQYLLRHQDMIDLLRHACETTSNRFGIRSQLSLKVYRDPEIEDQYLTLYVRQEQYDEQILDEIEEIRLRYEDLLADRSGWLLVTTDFRPPR